jgi:hypothetical protein
LDAEAGLVVSGEFVVQRAEGDAVHSRNCERGIAPIKE